jgi:hypothetical protein
MDDQRIDRKGGDAVPSNTFRFRLRHLFVVMTSVACGLAAVLTFLRWGNDLVMIVERDAAKQHYDEGAVTREQARQWVGDVVDQWPEKGVGVNRTSRLLAELSSAAMIWRGRSPPSFRTPMRALGFRSARSLTD